MRPRSRLFPFVVVLLAGLLFSSLGTLSQTSSPTQSAPTQSAPSSYPPAQQQPAQQPPPGRNQDTLQLPPGQQQPQEPKQEGNVFVFTSKVEEVILHATVVDEHGRLVTNLDKNAFNVYEDGQPVQITSFRHEDIPVALGIIVDNSGSMRDKRMAVNRSSLNLVRSSNPEDQVFIVNFNDESYIDQDFTNNIDKLKEGLEHIESRGGTALYDAVVASADHLKKQARQDLQKKVILVITDGEDNASRESLEQTVRRVSQEGGPTVYSIGILGEERSKRAKRALSQLSEQTGGLAFFPKDASEVDTISQTIARDIRNQYTIGYKKNKNAPMGYRTVKVVAHAPGFKNLQVRTLTGYFAGQERAAR